MKTTIEYFFKREWSMGNGQCPDCCGSPPDWIGHPCHPTAKTIGHEKDCPLAACLKELGDKPIFIGEFNGYAEGDIMYEKHYDENNRFSHTRVKKQKSKP